MFDVSKRRVLILFLFDLGFSSSDEKDSCSCSGTDKEGCDHDPVVSQYITDAGAAFVPKATTNGENDFVSNVRVRFFAL